MNLQNNTIEPTLKSIISGAKQLRGGRDGSEGGKKGIIKNLDNNEIYFIFIFAPLMI